MTMSCNSAWGCLLSGALLVCGTVASAATEGNGGDANTIFHATAHDALYDIAFEGRNGIAVGAFGIVLTSEDGGSTWLRQWTAPDALALLGVAMRAGKCVIVGQMGSVFAADGCRQWKRAAAVTKARLVSVSVNGRGEAYAVGAFGTILKSADWGNTWKPVPMDWSHVTADGAEPHLYGVHLGDDGAVTLVGEFELILRSLDGGVRWTELHKGERSLFALYLGNDGKGYAVGQAGAVLGTSDGGATWRSLDSGTTAILTGVAAAPNGGIVATGINTILYSADGGRSWDSMRSKLVSNAWHEAAAISGDASGKQRILTVGAGGTILELNR